jgi:hypothetical protein
MLRLIENGRLVEWIIGAMVIEAVVLWLWHRRRGSGPILSEVLTILASGICLMLALRAALRGEPALQVAIWLGAAGIAHVADLWVRWRRPGSGRPDAGRPGGGASPQ